MYWALVTLVGTLFFIYKYITGNKDYWAKKGIQSKNANIFWNMIKKRSMLDIDLELYQHFKEQGVGGLFEFRKPTLLITDLDLVRNVMVKDFDNFVNRRTFASNNDRDKASFMLFMQQGHIWKGLRATLSPLFTTGKIKRMFQTFDECGATLVEKMKEKYIHEPVDIDDVVGRYTMSVIANSVFGIDAKVYEKEISPFIRVSDVFSRFNIMRIFVFFFASYFPKLSVWLNIHIFGTEMNEFYTEIVLDAMKKREKMPDVKWNDFLELMMETRAGKLSSELEDLSVFEKEAQLTGKSKIPLNDNLIIGNCILFLAAGFDTTRTGLLWSIYYLAIEPEIQERLYEEIKERYDEDGGKFTYESVNNLDLMGRYYNEVLRLRPPVARLERRCEADYQMETRHGKKFSINKGTIVQVPVYAVHMDPEQYPNPEKFDPERWTNEAKNERHPYSYQPFGNGPRNCIGMRFALTESKIALAHIVYNFKVTTCAKTEINPKTNKIGNMKPINKMYLNFTPRN